MNNPDDSAAVQNDGQQEATFQALVNTALDNSTENEKGKIVFPPDTTVEVKYAAMAESRRRNTQGSYSKGQQDLKAMRAENEELRKLASQSTNIALTEEQQTELEDLKFSDPDAWRAKLNELEGQAREQTASSLQEVKKNAGVAAELERRAQVLAEYNNLNPGVQITNDAIANEVPPRITKQLETGEVTFEEFLALASNYLTPSTIGQAQLDTPTNIGSVGGGSTVSEAAASEDVVLSYTNEIY